MARRRPVPAGTLPACSANHRHGEQRCTPDSHPAHPDVFQVEPPSSDEINSGRRHADRQATLNTRQYLATTGPPNLKSSPTVTTE
jgi:hypothetical protein